MEQLVLDLFPRINPRDVICIRVRRRGQPATYYGTRGYQLVVSSMIATDDEECPDVHFDDGAVAVLAIKMNQFAHLLTWSHDGSLASLDHNAVLYIARLRTMEGR